LFLATALALLSREKTTLLFRSRKLTFFGKLESPAAYAASFFHDCFVEGCKLAERASAFHYPYIHILTHFASLAVFWQSEDSDRIGHPGMRWSHAGACIHISCSIARGVIKFLVMTLSYLITLTCAWGGANHIRHVPPRCPALVACGPRRCFRGACAFTFATNMSTTLLYPPLCFSPFPTQLPGCVVI